MPFQIVKKFLVLFFCLSMIFVACSPIEPVNVANTLTPKITSTPIIVVDNLIPTQAVTETALASPLPTTTHIPVTLPAIEDVPPIALRDDCPTLVDPNLSPFWKTGSILFESDNSVWAISANSLTPQKIFSPEFEGGYFKPYIENGTEKLLIADFLREDSNYYVIYDLANHTQTKIPIKEIAPPIPLDDQYIIWLSNNQIKFLTNLERVAEVGEVRTFSVIDLTSEQIKTITEELNLPGYAFYQNNDYFGFASVDPTQQTVLYTTMENPALGLKLVLRDLETGQILWQQKTAFWATWPIPTVDWDKNGRSFLFSSELEGQNRPLGFINVQTDGKVAPLPHQPFPLTEQWPQVNELSRSPDGRFIYYHLGVSPGRLGEMGPGVILDTVALQAGTICSLTFTETTQFYGGKWISDTLFLYLMKVNEETLSLQILDVSTWKTQLLTELVAREYFDNAYGWTPIELEN